MSPERSYRVVPVMWSLLTCPSLMQGLFEERQVLVEGTGMHAEYLNTFAPEHICTRTQITIGFGRVAGWSRGSVYGIQLTSAG